MDPAAALEAYLTTLAGAPLPEWALTEASMQTRTYAKDASLLRQGDPDETVRFVFSGLVRLSYEDAAGRRLTKSIVQAGGAFASLTALEGGSASFSATALSPVTVASLPYPLMRQLADRHHAWERLAGLLFMQLARRKEQREFELLTLSAEQRWRRLCQTEPGLVAAISQAELAALIGITPVALSRIKHRGRSRPRGPEPEDRTCPVNRG